MNRTVLGITALVFFPAVVLAVLAFRVADQDHASRIRALEEDLELDEEPESIDDVGSVLRDETEPEEGFQIEGEDSLDDDEDDDSVDLDDEEIDED